MLGDVIISNGVLNDIVDKLSSAKDRCTNRFFITRQLGGCGWLLTGDQSYWVKLNIRNDVGSCQGAYLGNLMKVEYRANTKLQVPSLFTG